MRRDGGSVAWYADAQALADLKRQAKAERDARILRAHQADPDLDLTTLGSRFGVGGTSVRRVLESAGIRHVVQGS